MANKKFSQFTSAPTPNANSFFVGYNSVTNDNTRTSLSDLITAIGAPSGTGTPNIVSKWIDANTLGDSFFYSGSDDIAKTTFEGDDKGLYVDFNNQVYTFGQGTRGLLADVGNNNYYLGDYDDNNNFTYLKIDDVNLQIKTSQGSQDKGLYLDFANQIYNFQNAQQVGLNITNGYITKLGDYTGNQYGYTYLTIDADASLIKTSNGGADKGLKLDFANIIYILSNDVQVGLYIDGNNKTFLGDWNEGINATKLIVDVDNQIIKTSNNYADQGLYLDFAGQDYFIGNTIRGLRIDFDNLNYYLGDWDEANNGTYIYINDNEDNFRITLNAKRTNLQNWSQANILGFPDPQAGDISYDADENEIVYYNGSSWQRLVHGPV